MQKKFGVPFSGAADEFYDAPDQGINMVPKVMKQGEVASGHSSLEQAGHDGYSPMAVSTRDGHVPMHSLLKNMKGA